MRIRTIKPEFWSHPVMARLPAETQLVALAILSHADDHGYFHADAAIVRGSCFPFRDNLAKLSEDISELARVGWIEVRKHQTQGDIGFVINWSKHQKVDHPRDSKIKTYFISEQIANASRNPREVVALDQGSGNREQGGDQGAPRPDLFDPKPPATPATETAIAIPFWLSVGGKDPARAEDDRAGFRELVVQHPRTRHIGEDLSRRLLRKVYLSELVAAVLEQTGEADGARPAPPAPPAGPSETSIAEAIVRRDGWEACRARLPAWIHARITGEQSMLLAIEAADGIAAALIAASKGAA